MMYRVGDYKHEYVIAHNELVVTSISNMGIPMFGGTDMVFPSKEAAIGYIESIIMNMVIENPLNDNVGILDGYSVAAREIRVVPVLSKMNRYLDLFNRHYRIDTEFSRKIVRSCYIHALRNGFARIGLYRVEDVQEHLKNPKYKDIFDEILPMHVAENLERFIYQGTNACNDEDKGAIIFTSTDEQLEVIGFKTK